MKYKVSVAEVEIEADTPTEAYEKFQNDPSITRIVIVEEDAPGTSLGFRLFEFELL